MRENSPRKGYRKAWEGKQQRRKRSGDVANAPPAMPTRLLPVSGWRLFTDDSKQNTSPRKRRLCRTWHQLLMSSRTSWVTTRSRRRWISCAPRTQTSTGYSILAWACVSPATPFPGSI